MYVIIFKGATAYFGKIKLGDIDTGQTRVTAKPVLWVSKEAIVRDSEFHSIPGVVAEILLVIHRSVSDWTEQWSVKSDWRFSQWINNSSFHIISDSQLISPIQHNWFNIHVSIKEERIRIGEKLAYCKTTIIFHQNCQLMA